MLCVSILCVNDVSDMIVKFSVLLLEQTTGDLGKFFTIAIVFNSLFVLLEKFFLFKSFENIMRIYMMGYQRGSEWGVKWFYIYIYFLLLLSLGNEFRCGLDVERIIYRDYFKRI